MLPDFARCPLFFVATPQIANERLLSYVQPYKFRHSPTLLPKPMFNTAISVRARLTTTPAPGLTMARLLTNFLIFQGCWLACVLSGAAGAPWLGIAAVGLAVTLHLWGATRPLAELALLSTVGLIGAVWDGLLSGFGWLVYPSGRFMDWIAPSWIIAMWIGFATTLNVSMRWLRRRYATAFFFGLVGGPLAFVAGARLGGVAFPDPVIALSAIAAGWSAITPMMIWLASQLDGFAPPDDAGATTARPASAEAS
jgi:hypothetical protein